MSFSTEVKNELCRVSMQRACCTRAEAYGALLHATVFSHREIRLSTENAVVARRLQALLQRAFFVVCEPQQQGRKYQIVLEQPAQIGRIFDVLGYDRKSHITYHLNRNELEEECCLASFLRGAFLMAGTVAGPDKKSHLELKSGHQSLAGEETSLLLDFGLSPKLAHRGGTCLLYFKDGASVEDFLTRIGAPHAAMALMEAKVEKNLRNTINRQVNCETANLVKTADAAARQIAAIRAVLDTRGEEAFPENLRETVHLRLAYPTDTLAELAQRFDPPISKPGLSHRLKKITEFASKED
ncbi:MAG TPA: DNA-binding protein WhiA [Candidatus Agathobaculum merdipullorum]|nr:DNA-binding protein WhiA [Candidatus Agathobaculum merdipullorum]